MKPSGRIGKEPRSGLANRILLVGSLSLRREVRKLGVRAIRAGIAAAVGRGVLLVDRRRGLLLLGQVAALRNRHDDQTEFWNAATRSFPNDWAFIRGQIDAALRSGKTADAEVGLSQLIDSRETRISDCRFVLGLSHIEQSRGNSRPIRARVRKFLRSMRTASERRVATVKLSRLIYAHFRLQRPKNVAAESALYRARFLAMLDRSDVKSTPKTILRRVVACETRLAMMAPAALFDTDVSVAQCRSFIALVRSKLARGEAFSFVRVGDGEAACLPYEPRFAALAVADAVERERIWWGRRLGPTVRARMARDVCDAIWNADCIGIPGTARFLRELQLTRQDGLGDRLTGRGLRSILYATERYARFRSPNLPAPVFASCHLHQDLARWNVYGELFDGMRDIVLVSCHPGLADFLSCHFSAHVKAAIVLPPDRISAPAMDIAVAGDLPRMLDEVVDRLGHLPRNRLVLVGAGYPGKWLVEIARARGGVALDLGSIFDYWIGLNTRSYLDLVPG